MVTSFEYYYFRKHQRTTPLRQRLDYAADKKLAKILARAQQLKQGRLL